MDAFNQAKNLIERSRNILILPSLESLGDSLASALALSLTLKKLGKNVNVFKKKIPQRFQFLDNLQAESPTKNFAISINLSGKEVSEMRYEKNEDDLKIYFALDKGKIGEEDISFLPQDQTNYKPDFLITLGVDSLENLREFFNQDSRLFYQTPILNIDNQLSNENFGQVNLVEIGFCSLAEITTGLIKLMDSDEKKLLDANTATCLLTGIIYATQNFRDPKSRPQTLQTSSYLIEKGANHQKIIQHLFKQKSIPQIKLLGRILEKLNFDEKQALYTVSLQERDFNDCQAASGDLSLAIEELIFNFRYLSNVLILWESHASAPLIKGIFYSLKTELIERILENFEGTSKGKGVLFLIKESDLNSAKEKVLKVLD